MKGKRERQRYTELNAEFQRIDRRDKKAFLSITMNKINGGDGIPAELFQILKKKKKKEQQQQKKTPLLNCCQNTWKTQQWAQDWKRSVFTPVPKKGNAKECLNYHIITLIAHVSKVMSLLLNMLSKLVITFLLRSKCFLISWL